MLHPKVSVIVPVYKAEKYLRKCVDSLLAQTLADIEILLIDDGSPDSSGTICDEYAASDPRVRVFHKENGGVSSARQMGSDNAQGEYVIHADPDDWVESTMLEELYNKAIEERADMVICDYYKNAGSRQIYVRQRPKALGGNGLIRELFQQLHGSCWNKLVRRVCYSENNVRFPEGISYREDLIFNIRLLKHTKRVSYLPQAFYHYVQFLNENSLCKNRSFSEEDTVNRMILEELPRDIAVDVSTVFVCVAAFRDFHTNTCTSAEFKKKYGTHAQDIFKKLRIPKEYLILLWGACKGFKWLTYPCYKVIYATRQFFKSFVYKS